MRILPASFMLSNDDPTQVESFEDFYRSLQASMDRRATMPPVVAEPPFVAATSPPPCPPPQASVNRQLEVPVSSPVASPPAAPGPPSPPPARPLARDPGICPAERRRSLIHRLVLLVRLALFTRGLHLALTTAVRSQRSSELYEPD
ncbi:hypothetical protein C0995_011402 [Termitomyces sp. Mi166|nr:hypothetical protein C0995_011402 [Termitomyces sp. Mi166\